MGNCIVLYGTKYGATREVAEAVADGLGAPAVNVSDDPDISACDLVVLGSPIYAGDYFSKVKKFIREHADLLAGKRVAAFVTTAAEPEIPDGLTGDEDEKLYDRHQYAEGLGNLSGGKLVASRGFGGRMVPEQLDDYDRRTLSWFYEHLMNAAFEGFDLIDLDAARQWGAELKQHVGA